MTTFFDTSRINIDQIAQMYNPQHPGCVLLRDILHPDGRHQVLNEIKQNIESKLKKAPEKEGSVWQEFFSVQIGRDDEMDEHASYKYLPALRDGTLPVIRKLLTEYTQVFHNPLAQRLTSQYFQPELQEVGSIGIHRYPADGGGLGYHRDFLGNINLIAALTLEGKSNFFYAQNKEGLGEQHYTVESGDLVLMRAHRTYEERSIRPYHKVESVGCERYAILFRTVIDEEVLRKNGKA